ncbi:uncharacterized protein LOC126893444 [Diabrotica virgifera virgifera]|uniref:Mutator-like transposase domain-containing protein n=1 Tax=Diabrotica virgifera virgifera TaxID=50390 RepID=A0ABM5LAY3_DIAVI|nr:uncharacterized protein LOC126880271 [Diabrotica virgifera virgifera]XP_050519601.1 uncharacterized protein LOC126893444 [Diabrotica virgifera virgifera]
MVFYPKYASDVKNLQENRRKAVDNFYNTATELMLAAGKEEESLAQEWGEVDPEDDKAVISVIADGAWARRSNKSIFSANSGVASIIGKRTGKLLYLGVKNKYCCVCVKKFYHSIRMLQKL